MSHGEQKPGVIHEDTVIHGKENIDSSRIGRMVAIRKPSTLPENGEPILVLDNDYEAWRNDEIESFTSSPYYIITECTPRKNRRIILQRCT